MKSFILAVRVCRYQLQILSRNYKSYTIPICMLIFMRNIMSALQEFLIYVNEEATPFLFPFLFNDVFVCALMFAVAILFYLDAPFYNKEQLFVIMRCGSGKWILGQILYVYAVSALYVFFLIILSVIILLPRITWENEWGKIWTTLSVTDAGQQFLISFAVPSSILFEYTPMQAMVLQFFMAFFICSFYGFLVWCLNLYFGKLISMVVALASILLVTRVRYFPAWVTYLVPSSWSNISGLSEYATHGISIKIAFLILIIGNIFLMVLAFIKTSHSDLAK